MKQLSYLLLSLALSWSTAVAQSVISGTVRTDKGQAVEYARILAQSPRDSAIIAYAFTDVHGAYKLSISHPESELLLSASSLEIEASRRKVRNVSQTCNFIVRESVIALKEVRVKAPKIWGQKDTINYSVTSFAGKHDVVIADVLRKMPGIEVSASGLIRYNGKAINKFYIEGLDALQGRYGIATNNISAKDVATVQVLENHQPIKALEKSRPSDRAAINLKLKESVKGTFSATAHLGLGYDTRLRRNEELMGMYFAKRRQHIYTLKSNDNGQSIRRELRSYHAESALPALQMAGISRPSAPSFRSERHYHNDTHALTANNLFKLNNDAELNANLIYYHDRERQLGGARTVYHLEGGDQVIEEDIESLERTDELEVELRYNRNKAQGYFNNLLRLQAEWGKGAATAHTGTQIQQALRTRYIGAENTTHWISRGTNSRGFEVFWRNGVASQPHQLSVMPGLYADRLNAGRAYQALLQDIRHRAFASDLKLSLLSALSLWGIGISPTAFLQATHNDLTTELGASSSAGVYTPLVDPEMHNHTAYTRLSAGIGQELSYKSERLKLGAVVPLFYYYTHVRDRVRHGEELSDRRLQFTPNLWMTYEPKADFELKLSGGIDESLLDLRSLYSGYILRSYRSLGRNQMQMFSTRRGQAGLSLAYKEIFSMFFIGGGINYARYKSEGISSLVLDGPLSITERLPLPNSGASLSLNLRTSKGFDWLATTLAIEGRAGRSRGESLLQRFLRTYHNEWLTSSIKLDLKPLEDLAMSYELSWGIRRSRGEGADWLTPVRSLNHSATIHLDFLKNLALKLTGEHYYNSAVSEGRNFTLADLGLIYTLGKLRLTLDWTNIFGAKTYTSAYVGDLISSYSYYHLRPSAVMLRARFKLF